VYSQVTAVRQNFVPSADLALSFALGTGPNQVCGDYDECVLGLHACGANKTCANTNGSYSCVCARGYIQNRDGRCLGMRVCAYARCTSGSTPARRVTALVLWACVRVCACVSAWMRYLVLGCCARVCQDSLLSRNIYDNSRHTLMIQYTCAPTRDIRLCF
jgi:hypothetical protein